jgi:hypothetical protein
MIAGAGRNAQPCLRGLLGLGKLLGLRHEIQNKAQHQKALAAVGLPGFDYGSRSGFKLTI